MALKPKDVEDFVDGVLANKKRKGNEGPVNESVREWASFIRKLLWWAFGFYIVLVTIPAIFQSFY